MRDIFDDESSDQGTNDFAKMFEQSMGGLGKKLSVGDKIRAEVLALGKEEIFVSTGTVDDGVILRPDFESDEKTKNAKVGDFLDLYVTNVKGSQIFMSPKPTAKNLSDDLEDAFDMMLPVEGRVTEAVNGGFRVNVLGKTAFCPMSQIDSRRVDDPQSYVGRKFDFIVTQFDRKGRNIVVSRRKLLDEQKEATLAAFEDEHKPGDMLKGVVTRLEAFGAFVEIAPGLEGLAHISELAWNRLGHPSEAVKVGQEVETKILKIEQGLNGRMNISLSVKQAMPTPWENFPANLREGEVVEGRVTRNMKFGAFVEVAPGIEGLVPLSEMSLTKRVQRPDEVVQPGQTVQVRIKEIRKDEQRLSLSIKDAGADADAYDPRAFAPGSSAAIATSGNKKSLGTLADQFAGLFDASASQNQSKKKQ